MERQVKKGRTTADIYGMLFELLRVAFGVQEQLRRVLTPAEWQRMYNVATKQAVVGIAFVGIEKLPKEQMPPEMLLFQWIGTAEQIKQQNAQMDRRTAKIWRQLKEDGLETAILKGQGIAKLYDNADVNPNFNLGKYRQSGDIDVWVKGGYDKVCDYVQQTHPTEDVVYHRFHYDFFKDTEVELHHRPTLMRNLFDDRKLAKWYNSFGADSFAYLEDKGFAVPPMEFNRIFILTHIYRHFLFEGIGLRQVIDYFFVLKNSKPGANELFYIRDFRMMRFAGAMMWILHTQFGLPSEMLVCEPNEKEGRFVLEEIMQTGNFGRGEKRYDFKWMKTFRRMTAHGIHLLLHYPSEVVWTPIWLIYHKVWKWNRQREIEN